MSNEAAATCRFFVTYSGVKLPLKLMNELGEADLHNRNTFFRGHFDARERLIRLEKMVYGELELQHVYAYHDHGPLRLAEITDADGEVTRLEFDEDGQPL